MGRHPGYAPFLTGWFPACLCAIGMSVSAWGIGFQPVSQEELQMTVEPRAPGAPAIILFREVDRDDNGQTAHEDVYFRVKILTDEGRSYADVRIPFYKEEGDIVNIHARTIRPDGTIVNFEGKPFTKMIEKVRGLKYMAKVFALPDVQVGSILEYYYTIDLPENALVESHWILSDELFTKNAKFSLRPYSDDFDPTYLRWTWNQLPAETAGPVEGHDNVIRLEATDIPAFETEDYMPPQNEMMSHVDFIYSDEAFETDPAKYWEKIGKKRNRQLEHFIGHPKTMKMVVARIVSPSDSAEEKLRKIYARVQRLRNTDLETKTTQQQQRRNKERTAENVEVVWKHQYARGDQLTWLFLALARASGFEAYGMWVPSRRTFFFDPQIMDSGRLNANVVTVRMNGRDVFFDPGAAFTPFGLLPWYETAVQGLKLDKSGGTWLQTDLPLASESGIARRADLRLTDIGDLEGKVTVTYSGLEASERRVEEALADETARKKFLEDDMSESIPIGCEVELTNHPDWEASSPLMAEYTLKVPGWGSATGRRVLLPVALFGAPEQHLFDHPSRVHPIYFQFPFQRSDDVKIKLPSGWQVSDSPQSQTVDAKAVVYILDAKNEQNAVHLNRVLTVSILQLKADDYETLRQVFQKVRTADEMQAILQPGASTASN